MNTTDTNSTFNSETEYYYNLLPTVIIPFHAINVFLGLPLNIYIIILLFPGRGVMEASDVLCLNQAFAEMFFVLLAPFHSLCSFSLKLCNFHAVGFLICMSMSSRCVFPCCVCLERYFAVIHPVIFLKYKSTRYRVAFSIMIWMYMLAISIVCVLTFPKIPYNIYSVMYVLVLSVEVFCGVSILKRLKHPGPQDRDAGEMNTVKKKAFQIISINLLIFFIQNIPICVIFGLENTVSQNTFLSVVMLSLGLNTVTGFWQPVFVLHKTGKLSLIRSTYFSTCCVR